MESVPLPVAPEIPPGELAISGYESTRLRVRQGIFMLLGHALVVRAL